MAWLTEPPAISACAAATWGESEPVLTASQTDRSVAPLVPSENMNPSPFAPRSCVPLRGADQTVDIRR